MPNTLAHIGIQGAASRWAFAAVDLKWVMLGLLIPDLPWILQRAARAVLTGGALYEVRLYAIVQSSLFCCTVLCGALALLSSAPRIVFLTLWANSALHLALDALQRKFANGVHFAAPLSWKLASFDLFWPENAISVGATLLGPLFLLYAYLHRSRTAAIGVTLRPARRLILAAALALTYAGMPLAMLEGPYRADNHFVRTLMSRAERAGRPIEFDRNRMLVEAGSRRLITFAGESLTLVGVPPFAQSGTVSLQGRFLDRTTVSVDRFHRHADGFRDWASYAGLVAILSVWGTWLFGLIRARIGHGT